MKTTIVPGTTDKFMKSGYIVAVVRYQNRVYHINAKTWLDFLIDINRIMEEHEITYPVGEDDETKMVTKKARQVDKLVR